ncbi:rhodanese-like domain-containing protein [Novipirellula caenicola]|uniref:Inner membrane protein YgaP n=1 Tax=Novipirellula caenicola TaxID=1536901 RepID=A0ABP9VPI4_9BACT
MSDVKTVSVDELAMLDSRDEIDLIDVRTPLEFREVRALMAENVPLDSLDPATLMSRRDPAKTLYVICKSGARGAKACQKLIDAGYTNVANVDGGTMAWDAAGYPVVRGKKGVSLERQVRIVAGTIVLISGILAITVSPYFAIIAAIMGAGLAGAGILDSCLMGMMLAKMPWNQVKNDQSCCGS